MWVMFKEDIGQSGFPPRELERESVFFWLPCLDFWETNHAQKRRLCLWLNDSIEQWQGSAFCNGPPKQYSVIWREKLCQSLRRSLVE